MAPSKEQLLDLYRRMVRIRTFEDRVAEIYWEDKLPAFDIGAGTITCNLTAGRSIPPKSAKTYSSVLIPCW
jgi:TPP-dependent pyruvate/acetoin dehydrogenase alpha subunit